MFVYLGAECLAVADRFGNCHSTQMTAAGHDVSHPLPYSCQPLLRIGMQLVAVVLVTAPILHDIMSV